MTMQFIIIACGVRSFVERKIRWNCRIVCTKGNFQKTSYRPIIIFFINCTVHRWFSVLNVSRG